MFVFGSHSKKRPDNLVFGRIYDQQVLDMVEFGVEQFTGLDGFNNEKVAAEIKPCVMFSGTEFEKDEEMKRVKSVLIDFFR